MIRHALLLPLLLAACLIPASRQAPGRVSVEVYRGLGGKAAGSFLPAVELVVDATTSMETPAAGSVTRLDAARDKATELLGSLPAGSQASVIVLGGLPGPECGGAERHASLLPASDPALRAALGGLRGYAEGSLAAALTAVASDLVSQGRARDTRVVLFTDLDASCGGDLCTAAQRLVASGAWLEVAVFGDAPAPDCLSDLRPSAELPGALVRALTRPTPAWRLVAPGAESGPEEVSDLVGLDALEAKPGEWSIALELDRPSVLGPLRVESGRWTRVRVMDFSGGPPRFAWEIVDERR